MAKKKDGKKESKYRRKTGGKHNSPNYENNGPGKSHQGPVTGSFVRG
jgi:hypothetical protein